MIRIRAGDQPRFRQRTEIRLREILTAREVIRHHAVGQELHTREPRDAPDEVHKPRTLLVIEKKRTMGDTTRPSAFRSAAPHPSKRFAIVGGYDQVITPVGKVDARFTNAKKYTTNKIYCGNLLWQSSLTPPCAQRSFMRLRTADHRTHCKQPNQATPPRSQELHHSNPLI